MEQEIFPFCGRHGIGVMAYGPLGHGLLTGSFTAATRFAEPDWRAKGIAFGQPIVCNDDAPMNELVVDGVNGLLVPSHDDGLANSGIPAKTVDVDALTEAISRLADPELRARLSAGALRTRDERSWDRTVTDFEALLS